MRLFLAGPAMWAGYDGLSVRRSKRRYEVMSPVEAGAGAS